MFVPWLGLLSGLLLVALSALAIRRAGALAGLTGWCGGWWHSPASFSLAGAVGLAAGVAVLVLGAAWPALASDGVVSINWGPVISAGIEVALPILGTALTGGAGLAVARGLKLLGLAIDARQRAVVDQVLDRAVSYGVGKLANAAAVKASGLTTELRQGVLAEAAQYAVTAAPQALAHFKATEEPRIRSMLESRLTNYLQNN